MVYSVIFFAHDAHSDDDPLLIGIYTTFTAALDTARGAKMHDDDCWTIKQHHLNTIDPGQGIWDSWTDQKRDNLHVYARYFPGGFPDPVAN